jgi:hypothetical protein
VIDSVGLTGADSALPIRNVYLWIGNCLPCGAGHPVLNCTPETFAASHPPALSNLALSRSGYRSNTFIAMLTLIKDSSSPTCRELTLELYRSVALGGSPSLRVHSSVNDNHAQCECVSSCVTTVGFR